MGADKWLCIHQYPHSEHNVKDCIDRLHEQGYWVAATLPDEQKLTIFDLPVERKTAFLFGTELTGLSDEAIKYADGNVLIPMYGFTESFIQRPIGDSPRMKKRNYILNGCKKASKTQTG